MDKSIVRTYHPKWSKDTENVYYINEDTTKLVIGTMPPFEVCNNLDGVYFFYGSKKNYFWEIINHIDSRYNFTRARSLEEINKRHIFLDCNHIGMIDIVYSCVHRVTDGKYMADDKSLLNIKEIDLVKVLNKYRKIDTLYLTSLFTLDLLKIYYAKSYTYDEYDRCGTISFNGIDTFKFYVLYSPSGRMYHRMLKTKRKILEDNYKELLK